MLLDMSDTSSERAFAGDIAKGVQSSVWRWTGQKPTIRLTLVSTSNLRYYIEFAVADATFKDTGPVTITYWVNDQVLDRVRYDTPGKKSFDRVIPPHFLRAMAENTLAAELDKPWQSPDGQKLGLILFKFGLQQ